MSAISAVASATATVATYVAEARSWFCRECLKRWHITARALERLSR
jgi:hypothetical protein